MNYREYIQAFVAGTVDHKGGHFWSTKLGKFRTGLGDLKKNSRLDDLDCESVTSLLMYNVSTDSKAESQNRENMFEWENQFASHMQTYSESVVDIVKSSENYMWKRHLSLQFLKKLRVIEEYLDVIGSLNIVHNTATARHFSNAIMIRKLIQKHENTKNLIPRSFLEIGAGAGHLSLFLQHFGIVSSYTIVDLPEMLIRSGYTFSETFGYPVHFPEHNKDKTKTLNILLRPPQIEYVPDQSVDTVINIHSFGEMDRSEIDSYFEHIYRVAKSSAIFVNINKRKRKALQANGTTCDNNPLLYPYRETDRILKWEEDRHGTFYRKFDPNHPIYYLRVALINPSIDIETASS